MNKFDLINKVLVSDLSSEDKCLLTELIMRADDNGECWPQVARLCKVRGIKHEKNFRGADHYLPGLVRKVRRGKGWTYVLNTPALEGVIEAEVVRYQGSWKQRNPEVTPAVAEVTPSPEGVVTPAVAEVTPAVEGVDSTEDNTVDSSGESTESGTTAGAAAPPLVNREEEGLLLTSSSDVLATSLIEESSTASEDSTDDTPAVEGVKKKMTWDEEMDELWGVTA